VPDGITLTPEAALTEAQRLLDDGLPFHAHEVLEASWKSAPPTERELWQGLAQLAVGLTHALRGNDAGAAALLRRGRDRIAPYAVAPPHRIDVAGLVAWADALIARCAASGHARAPAVPALRRG
jgi:predicted metal-dependent hydrolase